MNLTFITYSSNVNRVIKRTYVSQTTYPAAIAELPEVVGNTTELACRTSTQILVARSSVAIADNVTACYNAVKAHTYMYEYEP